MRTWKHVKNNKITEWLRLEGWGCIAGSWSTWCPPAPPQVLFCRAAFQMDGLQPILAHGVICPQVEDFTLLFIKFHSIPVGSFLQPTEVPLNSSTTQISWSHLPSRDQAGPWRGQTESQLLTFLLDVQSLCHVKGLDSAVAKSPQNAKHQLQGISITSSPGSGLKRGILFPLSLSLFLKSWLFHCLYSDNCQTIEFLKNFRLMGWSLTLGRSDKLGNSYVGVCGLFTFLGGNLGYLHCVVKVES